MSASDEPRFTPVPGFAMPPADVLRQIAAHNAASDEPREKRTGTIRDEAIRQLNELDARTALAKASGEPHEDELTLDDFRLEMRQSFQAWKLVAPFITPSNAPVLAAVLAEVAECEKSPALQDDTRLRETDDVIVLKLAATAIIELLRRKAGGAT